MKLKDIICELEVKELSADPELDICGIAYDSRRVVPGGVFIAINGFEIDGHNYIPMAAEKGAAAVICSKKPETDIPYILVGDTRKAMALASAAFYGKPSEKMTMIGVTGTNGKTSVTYLLKAVLESRGYKVGLIGTIQNMIGDESIPTERTTPESCDLQELFARMVEKGCTHVIMEVSSHSLALSRVEGIRFKVGIFTNLTEDHLDFHGNMKEYLLAKAKLFTMCDRGVLNLDDSSYDTLKEKALCGISTYSINNISADVTAENIELKPDSIEFEAHTSIGTSPMKLGIPGKFSVYNALAVIAAALELGVVLKDIAAALSAAKGVKGRVEVVPTGKDFTMIIDYAHTPDALENVLKTIGDFANGRIVTLFGCGGDRDPIKRPIMGKIAMEGSDFVVFTSDNPRTEEPGKIISDILAGIDGLKTPHIVIQDRREAILWAMQNAMAGDIILLAGKGHETYQILGKEKVHLDEREEIAKNLLLLK